MAFSKINEFVKENGVTPSSSKYHTLRELKDENDNAIGKIRILVTKAEPERAHVELLCPECKKESYQVNKWNDFKSESGRKSPFVVHCPHCSNKIQVRKMQDEVKKKKKSGE